MSNNLDFTLGDDSGEADEAAISPVENGENAVEEVFNRPTHAVRQRSEILRGEVNHRRWVDDADRGAGFFLNGGTATWGGSLGVSAGTGELVLSAGSLRISPMYGPGVARSDYFEDAGTDFVTRFAHFLSDNGTPGDRDIQWVSKKYDFEGGNEITITVTGVAGYGATTVVVSGDSTVANPGIQPGQDDIVVTYDSTAGTPVGVDDIISAINGDSIANQLVTPTYAPGNIDPITDPAYDIATTKLSGGIDGVHHVIPFGNLSSFFTTSTDNLLEDGDTLAIWYADTENRRRSVEGTSEHTIPVASLVNLTREPDKAPNAVIIGRARGDYFEFANGATITRDVGYDDIAIYVGADATGFTTLSTASTTQQAVNDDIDTELGVINAGIATIKKTFDVYTDLEDFIANTVGGDMGLIDHEDLGLAWSRVAAVATGNNVETLDSDGEYLITGEANGDVKVRDRNTLLQTNIGGFGGLYVPAVAITVLNTVRTNGEHVAIAHDSTGEVLVRDTNTQLFDFAHGAVVTGCCMDATQAYFCGATGTGSVEVRAYDFATQTEQWTYAHDAAMFAICTDGRRVYVAGNAAGGAGTSTAGVHIVALDTTNGAQLWEVTASGVTTAEHGIATDGHQVLVSDATTGITIYDAATGAFLESIASSQSHVAVDREYQFWCPANGTSRQFLHRGHAFTLADNVSFELGGGLGQDIATDGEYVFVAQDIDAGDSNNSLIAYYRYNRVRRWKRVDPSSSPPTFWPFQTLGYEV